MAGRFSSIVFGIVNMMGNGAGFLVPQVMGKILNEKDQGNPESWTYVFGIPCKFLLFTIEILIMRILKKCLSGTLYSVHDCVSDIWIL